MEPKPDLPKLMHDVQSKCASLRSAAVLLKDCPAGQKREMVALMMEESRSILACLAALDNALKQP